MTRKIAVVGAGPAGVRAVEALVAHGIRPLLIDEADKIGGQIYRQPPDALTRAPSELYGFEHRKASRLFADFAGVRDHIDYRPNTLVWNVYDRHLYTMCGGDADRHAFDALILATGATDRVTPLPGWTVPGVYTLGGAQVALKSQGCAVGGRTVFLGGSPLLYLVAYQYVSAGGTVAAVLDTAPLGAKLGALPGMAAQLSTLAKGIYYAAALRRHGVPIFNGAVPVAIEGEGHVEAIRFKTGEGATRRIECDAFAYGFGLKPEAQLADLAGCGFAFDTLTRQWLPAADAAGRAGEAIYLAGDGARIRGADAAEASGRLAALALIADLGLGKPDAAEMARLERRLAGFESFQKGLAKAFSPPPGLAASLPDDTIVCRCEAITAGELRGLLDEPLGPREMNRAKALSRVGMGRCQGRFCATGAAEIIAGSLGCGADMPGRLRSAAPVKPLVIRPRELSAREPQK